MPERHPMHTFFEAIVQGMNCHPELVGFGANFLLREVKNTSANSVSAVIHRDRQFRSDAKDKYDRTVSQIIAQAWKGEYGKLEAVSGGPTSSMGKKNTVKGFENHPFLSSFLVKFAPSK